MRNLLSIESLTRDEILEIIALGGEMKALRGRLPRHPLRHRCWGMIFNKTSTRTRVSFEVGIRELGGDALFFNANDLQLGGRGEPIEDTARVFGRMLHGVGHPHLRAERRGNIRPRQRPSDRQRADRRRASLPDPR